MAEIGQRVYYLNKYYNVVYARIESIHGNDAIIRTEYGRRLDIKLDWLNEFNRVCPPDNYSQPDMYLTCFCGSIRFDPDGDTYICAECGATWTRDELGGLSMSEYKERVVEKNEILQ